MLITKEIQDAMNEYRRDNLLLLLRLALDTAETKKYESAKDISEVIRKHIELHHNFVYNELKIVR